MVNAYDVKWMLVVRVLRSAQQGLSHFKSEKEYCIFLDYYRNIPYTVPATNLKFFFIFKVEGTIYILTVFWKVFLDCFWKLSTDTKTRKTYLKFAYCHVQWFHLDVINELSWSHLTTFFIFLFFFYLPEDPVFGTRINYENNFFC